MPDDKMPMQDGSEAKISTQGGPFPGISGAGESGGGAYPNPHAGKAPKDDFLARGGQTGISEKSSGGEVQKTE